MKKIKGRRRTKKAKKRNSWKEINEDNVLKSRLT